MNFRPLNDMILVKPDAIDDKIGSIYLPQGVLKSGDQPGNSLEGFVGTVAAVGPGDTLETLKCHACKKTRKNVLRQRFGGTRSVCTSAADCECGSREYDVVRRGHVKMLVKVGDRVIFPRRPNSPGGEFSLMVEGEKYIMLHEEQNAFAIVTGA